MLTNLQNTPLITKKMYTPIAEKNPTAPVPVKPKLGSPTYKPISAPAPVGPVSSKKYTPIAERPVGYKPIVQAPAPIIEEPVKDKRRGLFQTPKAGVAPNRLDVGTASFAAGLLKGVGSIVDQATFVSDKIGIAPKVMKFVDRVTGKAYEAVSGKKYTPQYKKPQTVREDFAKAGEAIKSGQQVTQDKQGFWGQAAESFGYATPSMVAGALSGGASAYVAGALEAGSEAQNVYDDLKAQGKDDKEARKKAAATFGANAVLNTITNKLGIFSGKGGKGTLGKFKKFFVNTLLEVGQEDAQQIISNMATGKPVGYGLKETTLLSLPQTLLFSGASVLSKNGREDLRKLQETIIKGEEAPQERAGNYIPIKEKEAQVSPETPAQPIQETPMALPEERANILSGIEPKTPAKPVEEPSKPELPEVLPEVEDAAQREWDNTMADGAAQRYTQITKLQEELKKAPKAQAVIVQEKLDQAIAEDSRIENEFVDRWRNINEVRKSTLDPETYLSDRERAEKAKVQSEVTKPVDIEVLHKNLKEEYKKAGKTDDGQFYKADEVLSNIFTQLELSEAGSRIFDYSGIGQEVKAIPSTFPKWIPEELRSKELFEKVMGGLDLENLKYPPGNRPKQRLLYDTLLSELDSELGVDTSVIRNSIIKAHENSPKTKTKKATDRRPAGGEGKPEKVTTQKEAVEKPVEKVEKSTEKPKKKETSQEKEARLRDENTQRIIQEFSEKEILVLEKYRGYFEELFARYDIITDKNPGLLVAEAQELAMDELVKDIPLNQKQQDFILEEIAYMGSAIPETKQRFLEFIVKNKLAEGLLGLETTKKEAITKPNEKVNSSENKPIPAYKGGQANADIGLFRDGTPIELGGMEKIRPIEMPEMVDLARELMGEVPKIMQKFQKDGKMGDFMPVGSGSIRLRASLFEEGNLDQAAKTLAHEIGHLVDYIPEGTMKRGNILGRLRSLQGYMKQTFTHEDGVTIKSKEIREELIKVSDYWRPWDRAKSSKSFQNYRDSSKELYADAVSMLFNSPGTLEKMAPKFYEEFFKGLDAKPIMQNAFFELQELLNGDKESILNRRREGVRGMFEKGDILSADIQRARLAEKEARDNNFLFKFKFNVIDKNFAMIDRLNSLKKKGVFVSDDENPLYYLEERNYLGGKIKAFMEKEIQPVYEKLKSNDISWTDFGEALFYDRIRAGDRSDVANPRGITPAVAEELLQKQFKELGEKKATILVEEMEAYRAALRTVTEEAFREGLYKAEMFEKMKENPAYATFQVLDHIEEGMTSKVHKSIGTLKDVANPADASLLKTITTIRAIERNKVARTTVEFLQKEFPEDAIPAKSVNTPKGKRYLESKLPNQDLIIYMKGGGQVGVYVDPYISKSIDNENIGQTISVLRTLNSALFRPLFITYNPGFQLTNFARDLFRTWKNMPGVSFLRVLKRYREASPVARVRAFGDTSNAILQKLESEQILSISYNQLADGADVESKQIDMILRNSGIETFNAPQVKYKALQPFMKVLEYISNMGDYIETLPKVAAYLEMSDGGVKEISREQKSYIRKNIGSPDFLAGGYWKPLTNEVFLFSNAITQGIRSDVNVATDPTTRGGYWFKTAKINILPKLVMLAAMLGLFGDEIKKIMEGASEYDKTNYTIIPLGRDENGKSIYLRIPQDEGGRLIGGLVWKFINSPQSKQNLTADFTDILTFAGGQIPTATPVITNFLATSQFIAGQNPYDWFRARNVLTDDQHKAGGMYAAKPFFGWLFNQAGGSIFYKFNNGAPREKSKTEKLFNLPIVGNIVGRFLKVSDYGTTESLNEIKDSVQREQARRRLDENGIINDYVRDARGTKDKDIDALVAENKAKIVQDVLGHAPETEEELTRAKNIIKKYQVALQRGESDPLINSLISAQTNEEKLELLNEIRGRLTKKEYNKLMFAALKYKIVSPEVFIKVEKPQ